MAKGRKTGGRAKGTPNKATAAARDKFRRMFEKLAPEAEGWIRETALGVPMIITAEDGSKAEVRKGADPRGAADLLLKLAEFHIPKLGRTEVSGLGSEALIVQIVKYSEEP